MADSKGYYTILGVSERTSYQEIKKAYRRLARKYHPDRNNSLFAEDMIKKINAAFEILSDEYKRKQYDKMDYGEGNGSGVERTDNDIYDNNVSFRHVDSHQEHTGKRKERPSNPWMVSHRSHAVATQFMEVPRGRFHIIVEPSLCMAFGSCETLAPRVFVLEKNKRINPKAIVESETGADFRTILAAAQTCPTKAIKLIDRYTGEQIYP